MVKVYSIKENYPNLVMVAEVAQKSDIFLLQELFRNAVKCRLGISTSFGKDEIGKDVIVSDLGYHLNKKFAISYQINQDHSASIKLNLIKETINIYE